MRRTRAGDAWAQRERVKAGLAQEEHSHGPTAVPGVPVPLGLPVVRTALA